MQRLVTGFDLKDGLHPDRLAIPPLKADADVDAVQLAVKRKPGLERRLYEFPGDGQSGPDLAAFFQLDAVHVHLEAPSRIVIAVQPFPHRFFPADEVDPRNEPRIGVPVGK